MSTRPRNAILRFLALFVAIYALFVIPWPGLANAYLAATNSVASRLLGSVGKNGAVAYQRDPANPWTSVQTLYKRSAKTSIAVGRDYNSRQDYLATALLVALVLATPIPRRRKTLALALGLVAIHAFILWRMWIGLIDIFSEKQLDLIHLSPFWKEAVRLAVQIFTGSIEATFIAPIFVWIVVTFRRGDPAAWGFDSTSAALKSSANGGQERDHPLHKRR